MSRAEECRRKAEASEAKAGTAQNEHAKEAYLEIARYWRELATETEKQELIDALRAL